MAQSGYRGLVLMESGGDNLSATFSPELSDFTHYVIDVSAGEHMKNATPAFVIGGMILGATLAWGGLSLPGVETGITFSVLVPVILIATLEKLPTATLAITLVGRGLGGLMLKADSGFSRGVGGVLAVAGGYLAAA